MLDQYNNASTFVTSTQLNETVCCGVDTVNTGKSAYPFWIEELDQYINYLGIQFKLPCTPRTIFFHGCQIAHLYLNAKRRCSQNGMVLAM